jgi:hypothetical protein
MYKKKVYDIVAPSIYQYYFGDININQAFILIQLKFL